MPLDEADLAKIAELIGASNATNNAELAKQFVTGDAATKMIGQTLTKGIADLDIGGQITAALAGLKPEPDKKTSGEVDPALAKLQEQFATQTAQMREAQTARETAESKARQQTLDGALRDGLTKGGVQAKRIPHVMSYLKTLKLPSGEPIVSISDAGELTYRQQRTGYVDNLSIDEGAAAFLATDDGKTFLPASGVNGDGQGAGGTGDITPRSQLQRTSSGAIDAPALSRRLATALKTVTIRP